MNYNNIYELKFDRLAVLLLPTMLRKPMVVAFLRAILSQVGLSLFMKFRRTANYRLMHNGQVCYLRKVLNDHFDPDVGERDEDRRRRITIGDGEEVTPTIVYWRQTERLVGVPMRANVVDDGALLIGWRGTVAGGGYDFTVRVPQEILDNREARLRIAVLIREYKLSSKQFLIKPLS